MKKTWLVLLAIVAVVVAGALFLSDRPDSLKSPDINLGADSGGTTDEQSAPVKPGDEQPVSTGLSRGPTATLSHVAYVHDGDTLYLQPDGTSSREDQIKVRLIGIDTPELKPEVECFGLEARDYLRGLLPVGTEVWIMPDREPFDQYGRALLYLWTTDDHSINLDLVENGYATALNIAPSNSYWRQFDAAESTARSANAGLWGSC